MRPCTDSTPLRKDRVHERTGRNRHRQRPRRLTGRRSGPPRLPQVGGAPRSRAVVRLRAAAGRRRAPRRLAVSALPRQLSIAGPSLFSVLLLTTTGRRTGRPRTTPVIYVRDGERLVVSCEHTGQLRPAAWPLNVKA